MNIRKEFNNFQNQNNQCSEENWRETFHEMIIARTETDLTMTEICLIDLINRIINMKIIYLIIQIIICATYRPNIESRTSDSLIISRTRTHIIKIKTRNLICMPFEEVGNPRNHFLLDTNANINIIKANDVRLDHDTFIYIDEKVEI